MRSDSTLSFSKKSYHRKQSVEKLYKLIKRKVLIDMRTVKRFRIWQILVLKRKIAIFMRKVKDTNKRFLQRSLKVIIEVLKKPIRETFNKIYNADLKIQIPKFLASSVALCKFSIITLKLLSRFQSSCLLPLTLSPINLKQKSFLLWKSRAYSSSPFLHRNQVLTLSIMGIILKHRWQHLNFAWRKVNRMRQRIESIMLGKSLKKLVNKKQSFAFRKISQPRFQRRKTETKYEKLIETHVKTGGILLEMMIRRRKGVEFKEFEAKTSQFFHKWKQQSYESIPNFIMKRHYRAWSSKLLANFIKTLQRKNIYLVWKKLQTANKPIMKNSFPIDFAIIENQATILVKLESQHYSKLRELQLMKKFEKLNKCRKVFWKCFRTWVLRWKEVLKTPDNLEVIKI